MLKKFGGGPFRSLGTGTVLRMASCLFPRLFGEPGIRLMHAHDADGGYFAATHDSLELKRGIGDQQLHT